MVPVLRAALAAAVLGVGVVRPAAAELADPMRPPTYQPPVEVEAKETTAPTFRLVTTVVAPGRRVAVVNGQRVRVGDLIDGARVVEIGPTHVRLRLDGEDHTARFDELDVKQTR